jgi:tRNA-uridine 2-sulfurtransferase
MKALGLLSGGLDSILSVKLLSELGLEVEAINFVTPFGQCIKEGEGAAVEAAKMLNVPLKVARTGADYIAMVRNPKHGYGKNLNPCIDCKIFMLKKAQEHANKTGAKFLFTGEVVGQRPMSQHRGTLALIEREAGLEGKLLRPLSAKLLPPTEAEEKGYVNREALRAISGRSRKSQIEMTKEFHITRYPGAAGGCLLTDREFSKKLWDLFQHKKRVTNKDVEFLKFGRHFLVGANKIIVGRNQAENETLLKIKQKSDFYFEVPNCGSPDVLLQGPKTKRAIGIAAQLTMFHSDKKIGEVKVAYGKNQLDREIVVSAPTLEEVNKLRI